MQQPLGVLFGLLVGVGFAAVLFHVKPVRGHRSRNPVNRLSLFVQPAQHPVHFVEQRVLGLQPPHVEVDGHIHPACINHRLHHRPDRRVGLGEIHPLMRLGRFDQPQHVHVRTVNRVERTAIPKAPAHHRQRIHQRLHQLLHVIGRAG